MLGCPINNIRPGHQFFVDLLERFFLNGQRVHSAILQGAIKRRNCSMKAVLGVYLLKLCLQTIKLQPNKSALLLLGRFTLFVSRSLFIVWSWRKIQLSD